MQSTTWSPMVSGPDDDFSTFLEFGDLQLNFPFDANPQNGSDIQDGVGPAIDMQANDDSGAVLDFHHGDLQQFGDPSSLPGFSDNPYTFQDLSMPPHLFEQQQLLHQYPQHPLYGPPYNGHHVIPPTPNSMEMHGGHAQYQHTLPTNHARTMYEQHRRQTKAQAAFTPLVSPAVTPHDARFRYQDYSASGEPFSPLTSPALEAQNDSSQRSVYSEVGGSDTSDTTSPIDMNIDMNIDPSLQPFLASAARKPRRRTSSAAQRNPQRAVRQSPSMKPQSRKKQLSTTSIPPKRVTGIIEDAENARNSSYTSKQTRSKGPISRSHDSSEAGSISPEPLSEVLMPPPATPKSASASRSPQINGATSGPQAAPIPATDDKPATPASLMRIRNAARRPAGSALKEQTSMLEAQLERTMDAITLPDASKPSSKRPALTPLQTSDTHADEATPTMSARKTPKIAPTSAPATATGSSFTSPNLNPMGSPDGSLHNRRGEASKNGRGGKKRTNSNSVQVSPALRPKISPSIKPLLPDGGYVSAETSALLLASKSNYQNLVEGTHLPGVSYPETLSTNLTSKRTSHKIAEQGRRNRINTALQEIAALLPPTPNGATPKDGMNGLTTANGRVTSPGASVMLTGTAAQQSNSKASTVELAIDYIKTLQGELQEVKDKLQLAEQKLAKEEQNEQKTTVVNGDMKEVTTTMTNGDGGTDGSADGNDDG